MTPYARLGGDSGVVAYALLQDAIAVEFTGGQVYLYTAQSAGALHLERMRALAARDDALLGGAAGTFVRAEVGHWLPHSPFAWSTFTVNLLGAFLLGETLEGRSEVGVIAEVGVGGEQEVHRPGRAQAHRLGTMAHLFVFDSLSHDHCRFAPAPQPATP